MVFVEVFVTVTIAAVAAIEVLFWKKICSGEEVPYLNHGPLFISRGEALAVMSSIKWQDRARKIHFGINNDAWHFI